MVTDLSRMSGRRRDRSLPEEHEIGRRRLASLVAAVAISFFILMGVSLAQRTRIDEVSPPIEDLRATYLPDPPPPPPQTGREASTPEWVMSLSESPSVGGIRVAASPPVTRPASSPIALPDLTLDLEAFNPDRDSADYEADHVFRMSEVDQAPFAVYQKAPVLPPGILEGVADPRVTLLFVIQDDGAIDSIKVLQSADPELDAVIIQTVKEWRFRPAIHRGKRVACWVQQSFFISRKAEGDQSFRDFR